MKEAIFALPDIEPSPREDDHAADEKNEGANSRSSWVDIKRDLNNAYPILDLVTPVIKRLSSGLRSFNQSESMAYKLVN